VASVTGCHLPFAFQLFPGDLLGFGEFSASSMHSTEVERSPFKFMARLAVTHCTLKESFSCTFAGNLRKVINAR